MRHFQISHRISVLVRLQERAARRFLRPFGFQKDPEDVDESIVGPNSTICEELLARSDIADELFIPVGRSRWEKDRLSLGADQLKRVRTSISGVRLRPADDTDGESPTQVDLRRLVDSIKRLRQDARIRNLTLSGERLVFDSGANESGSRVKFGLRLEGGGRFTDDRDAAAECHRVILAAIRESGLVVEAPKKFQADAGMDGLTRWASEVRLRPLRIPRWLWLLPLLLLAALILRDCSPPRLFVPISTNSAVVVLDASGSMQSVIDQVKREARQTLEQMSGSFFSSYYVDVVAFDQTNDSAATSALGTLEPVTEEGSKKLLEFVEQLGTHQHNLGGWLAQGLDVAAKEIVKRGEPTTLLIITDGVDDSLPSLLADPAETLARFKGIPVKGFTMTPRVLGQQDPSPSSSQEQDLARLAEILGGSFGDVEERK